MEGDDRRGSLYQRVQTSKRFGFEIFRQRQHVDKKNGEIEYAFGREDVDAPEHETIS